MTWALVLSGGGPAALVWQTALLAGLRDGGADLTRPDLLVGTSAGALLGGQVLAGHHLGRLLERQREGTPGAFVVRGALSSGDAWPELPCQITALDADSGALVVWSRTAGVPFVDAVASSCGLPLAPAVTTIAGRRYREASTLSRTSAQLAFGHRLVIVVAVARPDRAGGPDPLDSELAQLRAGGSQVRVLTADPGAADSLDEDSPVAAATAGYARGRALADAAGNWLRSRHAFVPMVDADDLAARFEALALQRAEWTHVAHLAVGAWHVHHYGASAALTRVRDGIRRLNVSIGGANTESSGYHETITAAYITLLAEFLEACPPGLPLAECLARLWTTPLAERDTLFTFYSRERLFSTDARARWVDPDLAPLRLEVVTGQ